MNLFWLYTVGLALAAAIAILRAFRGPSHLDRVLALDYLSIVGIGAVILMVVTFDEPLVLDVGICLALVGFLTAFIFARDTPRKGD